jgi:hypothetical protein
MKALGLTPTKNSGSGWIEKEDGVNDYILCQLKSTDAQSIKVNQKDIRMLEYNAGVSHKIPVFAIQFLNTGEVWLMSKPEDLTAVSQYIQTGVKAEISPPITLDGELSTSSPNVSVRSSHEAREAYMRGMDEKYKKKSRSAK